MAKKYQKDKRSKPGSLEQNSALRDFGAGEGKSINPNALSNLVLKLFTR